MSFDLGKSLSGTSSALGAISTGAPSFAIPASTVSTAQRSITQLSGSIGGLSNAGALKSLATTAETVGVLPIVVSPLVTAATARAAYRTAIAVAQARIDEQTAITYATVFETIIATANIGLASLTIPLTVEVQTQLVPLLERNGYVTITGKDTVEIKWGGK